MNGAAAENIRVVAEVEQAAAREVHLSERISLAIARFVGSMPFVVVHAIGFVVWAAWNAAGPAALRFDPYPFTLLTLIVSTEGVLVATFVLITQNRMSRQSDQRDQLNLQIDMLAEQEMTMVLRLLRRIADRLDVACEGEDAQRAELLTQQTNIHELVDAIRDAPAQKGRR